MPRDEWARIRAREIGRRAIQTGMFERVMKVSHEKPIATRPRPAGIVRMVVVRAGSGPALSECPF